MGQGPGQPAFGRFWPLAVVPRHRWGNCGPGVMARSALDGNVVPVVDRCRARQVPQNVRYAGSWFVGGASVAGLGRS